MTRTPNGTLMRHAVSSDARWLAGTEFRTGLQNGEPIHVWDTQKGENAVKFDSRLS